MKLNIAYPITGGQKTIEIDDEKKLHIFWDKRISQEVEADALGEEFAGYVLRITGGHDKQGFPMLQGVLHAQRVRLLLNDKQKCYRERRNGTRKRKSVRGCIVGPDISALALVVVKKGPAELPGVTDVQHPRRLGPKRASKIRKLYGLTKDDDVRKYVVRRTVTKEGKKPYTKAPKIQRLVTPVVLQRKRHRLALKRERALKEKRLAAEYHKMLTQRRAEKRQSLISKKKSTKK